MIAGTQNYCRVLGERTVGITVVSDWMSRDGGVGDGCTAGDVFAAGDF